MTNGPCVKLIDRRPSAVYMRSAEITNNGCNIPSTKIDNAVQLSFWVATIILWTCAVEYRSRTYAVIITWHLPHRSSSSSLDVVEFFRRGGCMGGGYWIKNRWPKCSRNRLDPAHLCTYAVYACRNRSFRMGGYQKCDQLESLRVRHIRGLSVRKSVFLPKAIIGPSPSSQHLALGGIKEENRGREGGRKGKRNK